MFRKLLVLAMVLAMGITGSIAGDGRDPFGVGKGNPEDIFKMFMGKGAEPVPSGKKEEASAAQAERIEPVLALARRDQTFVANMRFFSKLLDWNTYLGGVELPDVYYMSNFSVDTSSAASQESKFLGILVRHLNLLLKKSNKEVKEYKAGDVLSQNGARVRTLSKAVVLVFENPRSQKKINESLLVEIVHNTSLKDGNAGKVRVVHFPFASTEPLAVGERVEMHGDVKRGQGTYLGLISTILGAHTDMQKNLTSYVRYLETEGAKNPANAAIISTYNLLYSCPEEFIGATLWTDFD